MRTRTLAPAHLMVGLMGLPEDFMDRVERLRRASGLTWQGLADCLDVDLQQVHRWRRQGVPSGDTLFALFLMAARVPGGIGILLGEAVSPSAPRG